MLYFSILIITFGALLVVLSMNIRWNFFLKAIHQMPNDKIMLTFDDGPHKDNTPKILDTLKSNNVKAMFFVIGKNVAAHPEIVKRMIGEGHLIGGHSYHHPLWFGSLVGEKLRKEIITAQHIISDIVEKPIKWFRPPFGVTNPKIAQCVKKESLMVVGWNIRSFDTAIKEPSQLLKRLNKKLKPGSIILLHDPLPQTSEILEEFITSTRKKGYEFDILKD